METQVTSEPLQPAEPEASAAEVEAYRRHRLWVKLLSRAAITTAFGLCLLLLHAIWPEGVSLGASAVGFLGLALGFATANFRIVRRQQTQELNEVVTNDLARLEQCFGILQKQVTVTIRTSESAVLETVTKLNRVHRRSADLQQRIEEAVGRSRSLSEDSLSEAGRNGESVQTIKDHQEAFVEARRRNQERIRAVVDQVRHLTPLTALIADISRQTNLLSINASIEAARAGTEGAGFKVVAAEVRRLSSQTSDAARQISEGIQAVATAIDEELVAAQELDSGNSANQLTDLAQHITSISESLNDVVPYMVSLSESMDEGMQSMTTDIIDAMGHMQFQDINRQLLEQVESALGSLSDHSAALYALVGGKAPPPPQALEELMARWVQGYVMHEQRVAHAEVAGNTGSLELIATNASGDDKTEVELTEPEGPKIELF